MIRLLIADDHPVVRAGIVALLSGEPDMQVLGEVGSPREAVAFVLNTDVDVVLMDMQFGGQRTGAEATRAIRREPSAPHVLVLTNYDTDADILAAVEAGASGYLLKDAPPHELAAAIRAAARGESALAPVIAARLMERVRTPQDALSARELEVLRGVAEGLSNTDIASALHITEATVKSHLVHMYAKLGVASRTSAVAEARRQGLLG